MAGSDILKIVIILIAIVAVGSLFGYKSHCDKKKAKLMNLREQAIPLQTKAINIDPQVTVITNKPMDLQTPAENLIPEQNACNRCDDYDDFDYKSMHIINDNEQRICAQDPLLPLCPGPGTTLYGMAVTDQSIYPGSYLPPAVFNTSGFSQSCAEQQGMPSPCYH